MPFPPDATVAAENLAATIGLQFDPSRARLKTSAKRRKVRSSAGSGSIPAPSEASSPPEPAVQPASGTQAEPETVSIAVEEPIATIASEDNTVDPSAAVEEAADSSQELESRLDEAIEKVALLGQLMEQDMQVFTEDSETPSPSQQNEGFDKLASRLDEVLDAVTGLQTKANEFDECRQWIQEIKANTEIGQAKRDILTGMLSGLNDEVRELRTQVAVTQKTAMASTDRLEEMKQALGSRRQSALPAAAPSRPSSAITPTTSLGVSVMVLSWAVMLYLRTESPVYLVLAVVVVNMAGCAVIMLGRRRASS